MPCITQNLTESTYASQHCNFTGKLDYLVFVVWTSYVTRQNYETHIFYMNASKETNQCYIMTTW